MKSPNTRRLMSRAEAAVILGIPDEDLQWLIDTRQLVELRIRGRVLFDSRDIDQLIDTYKNLVRSRKEDDEVLI